MIYLDNSATTRLDERVIERMERFREESFANAGSVHQGGQRARVELDLAREVIARSIGAEPREVIFTSGGTEANNHALKGYAFRVKKETGTWPTIVTDRTEHHAILHPVEFLASLGATVRYVETDEDGRITPERLDETISSIEGPFLVSIMYANNEIGTINPIAELAEVTHRHGGHFHSDGVQALGKISCAVRDLGVDMMSFSAHKLHGPKGIGALYVNRELELEPLMHGGAQERDRRGGTEPVELAVGFAEAVRIADEGLEENRTRLETLREELRSLLSDVEGIIFNTPTEGSLPTILNITFDHAEQLDGDALIIGMDIRGIAVSNGSACTSGSMQPSHVLLAIGRPPAQARAAIRFSLSRDTRPEELREAVDGLREALGRPAGRPNAAAN